MFCVGDSKTLLDPFSIIWRLSGYFIFCERNERITRAAQRSGSRSPSVIHKKVGERGQGQGLRGLHDCWKCLGFVKALQELLLLLLLLFRECLEGWQEGGGLVRGSWFKKRDAYTPTISDLHAPDL